jgi:hypothetical protein
LFVPDALMAVIAVGMGATDEAGRVPAFAAYIFRKMSLCIVDDVAAALDGANVLLAVAPNRDRRAGP